MTNKVWTFAVAGTLGALLISPGTAMAAPQDAARAALRDATARAYPGEGYNQYRGYGPYRPYGYRGGYRGGNGAGLAAGIIGGLAAGALIGGALSTQAAPAYGQPGPGAPVGNVYGRDPNWVSYCASRYPNFDPVSGTFVASDGYAYPCR